MPITSQKSFDQRCEHERLRLLLFARKRYASTATRRNFTSVHDIRRDDVFMSYDFPPGNSWVMRLPLIVRDPSLPIIPAPVTTGSILILQAVSLLENVDEEDHARTLEALIHDYDVPDNHYEL